MKRIKLGEVLDIRRGMSLSGDYYATSGNLIRLTLGNFSYPDNGWKENTSKDDIYFNGPVKPEFILKKGDIITPLTEQVRGLLGNTATVPEDEKYIQSGDVGLVIPDETKLYKRFAYYLVSSPIVKKQLDAGSQQTKIRHTSPTSIKNCVAYIPDIPEQKKIADFLDGLNAKIDINNVAVTKLKDAILTVFTKWFYQLEYPGADKSLPKTLGNPIIFNEELVNKLPIGWKIESIAKNSLCSFVEVGVDYFEKKNYLATANIDGTEVFDGNYVTFENRESRANMQPSLNSVWFAKMKNSVKHFFVSSNGQWIVDKYILSTGFSGLQCDDVSFAYIASVIMQPYFEKTKDILSHGATQESVNNEDLKSIPLIVPSHDILIKYKNIVEPYFKKMNDLLRENQLLSQTRNDLLPLLLNGQVTIK